MMTHKITVSTTEVVFNQTPICQTEIAPQDYQNYLKVFNDMESYDDVISFIREIGWDKSYSDLVMERLIPLQIEIESTNSTRGSSKTGKYSKKLWPDVKRSSVLIIQDTLTRPNSYEVEFASRTNKIEYIISAKDAYDISRGKKKFYCISSPSQKIQFDIFHDDLLIKEHNLKERLCEKLFNGEDDEDGTDVSSGDISLLYKTAMEIDMDDEYSGWD